VKNFCHFLTNQRPTEDKRVNRWHSSLNMVYVQYMCLSVASGDSPSGRDMTKKNWHIVKNAIYTLKNHVTWVQFETSCLLHISFRNWDIHVNHIREYCQLCGSVVSYHANGVWISVKVYPLFQNIFTRHRPYKCSSSLGPQASTYWQDKPFFTCCQSNGSRITARHW